MVAGCNGGIPLPQISCEDEHLNNLSLSDNATKWCSTICVNRNVHIQGGYYFFIGRFVSTAVLHLHPVVGSPYIHIIHIFSGIYTQGRGEGA